MQLPPRAAADSHDLIEVRGARENNLAGVSVDIPNVATDAYAMLRIVFSRLGTPYVGTSGAFSFNTPEGMCPTCEGLGRVSDVDVHQLVDVERSLHDGAITAPNFAVDSWYWRIFVLSGFVDPDLELQDYPPGEVLAMSVREGRDFFPSGPARVVLDRLADVGLGYLGLGQPFTTLSGGERQRLKLAVHMAGGPGSTCWTSRPPGYTWPTSTSYWHCWTGSSTPATR